MSPPHRLFLSQSWCRSSQSQAASPCDFSPRVRSPARLLLGADTSWHSCYVCPNWRPLYRLVTGRRGERNVPVLLFCVCVWFFFLLHFGWRTVRHGAPSRAPSRLFLQLWHQWLGCRGLVSPHSPALVRRLSAAAVPSVGAHALHVGPLCPLISVEFPLPFPPHSSLRPHALHFLNCLLLG